MRIILKIILFPITLVLSVVTLFLTFLLSVGTFFLSLISVFAIFGFIAALIEGNSLVAIEAIVIAYLFSPYGIPLIGAFIVSLVGGVNEVLKSI